MRRATPSSTRELDQAPIAAAPRGRPRRIVIALAGVALLLAVGAIVYRSVTRPAAPRPSTGSGGTASRLEALPHLTLTAAFPLGWEHVPGSDATRSTLAGAHSRSSIAFRGGTADDPEHGAFVSVMPLPATLEQDPARRAAALLPVMRAIEDYLADQLADGSSYRSEGCEEARLAKQRVGLCSGTATRQGGALSLRMYLRLGTDQALAALFAAKPTVANAAAEADQVFGSLSSASSPQTSAPDRARLFED